MYLLVIAIIFASICNLQPEKVEWILPESTEELEIKRINDENFQFELAYNEANRIMHSYCEDFLVYHSQISKVNNTAKFDIVVYDAGIRFLNKDNVIKLNEINLEVKHRLELLGYDFTVIIVVYDNEDLEIGLFTSIDGQFDAIK